MTVTLEDRELFHHDRDDPFGVIGGKLTGVTDGATALRRGGLNWTVETHPFTSTIVTPSSTELTSEGVTFTPQRIQNVTARTKRQVVRVDPDGTASSLNAVVGSGYTPIQHQQVVELIQNLVDSSDFEWRAAGHTHGGLRAFFQVALPEHILIGGVDPINLSLVVQTRHDGTGALIGVPTAFRFWCTNLLPALRSSSVKFSIQHSRNADTRITEIRQAIGLTFKAGQELQEIGKKLIDAQLTRKEFLDFVDVIYPIVRDETGKETDASYITRDTVKHIYLDEPDQAKILGTRWGAFQAVNAYEDYHRPAQGKQAVHLARRIVNRQQDAIKHHAMDLLLVGA